MTIGVPLLVAVVGLLAYAFGPGKSARLGEIAFFVGLLWLVYGFTGHAVRLL